MEKGISEIEQIAAQVIQTATALEKKASEVPEDAGYVLDDYITSSPSSREQSSINGQIKVNPKPSETKGLILFEHAAALYKTGVNWVRNRRQNHRPVTVTGLALALGLSSVNQLRAYTQRKEYAFYVNRLLLLCENYYEENLTLNRNPMGAIFALRSFGWSDNPNEVDSSSLSLADAIDAGRKAVTELNIKDRTKVKNRSYRAKAVSKAKAETEGQRGE